MKHFTFWLMLQKLSALWSDVMAVLDMMQAASLNLEMLHKPKILIV
jgi:hypothetical protein